MSSLPNEIFSDITNFLPNDDITDLMLLSRNFNALVTPRLQNINEEMTTMNQSIENIWKMSSLKKFEPIGSAAKKHMREMFATADKFLPNARDDEWAEIKEKMSLERFSYWTFLRIFCALLSSEEFRGNHSIPSDTAKEFHNAALECLFPIDCLID